MAVVPITAIKNNKIPDILITKCEKVTVFDKDLKKIGQDLIDTALVEKDPEAAGLAAPQIGVNKRVCLVREFKETKNNNETIVRNHILVNPEITGNSSDFDIKWEACLSVPKLSGKVQRYKRVSVIANDMNGKKIKFKASGFFARVIQHEIDHLNGILFTTKVVGDLLTDEELEKLYNMPYTE